MYSKIIDIECEFEFHELHLWLKHKYLDQQDDIKLWEFPLPPFSFPQTHDFPNLVTWCQTRYVSIKREMVA